MKKHDFWKEVEARVAENRTIVGGGMPPEMAPVMEWVGLRFWLVGGGIALIISSCLWLVKYEAMMRFIRIMIWR